MIIGIDGYEANVSNRVGVGRYAFEILTHLYNLLKKRTEIEVSVYLPDNPMPEMPPERTNWHYRVAGPKKLWTFFGLPLAIAEGKHPDVFFSPTHYVPRFVRTPRVFSVMDLSYLVYPEMFKAKDLHQLVNWTKYSVRFAAKILTISEFSKNAIIKAYKVPENRVIVTYPGMNKVLKTKAIDLEKKYGLSRNYILSVGTLQPRKNFVRLIEAFSRVVKDAENKYPGISLVIVGKKGWLFEEILKAPKKFGVEDKVKFLDFVPDEDLPSLYSQALCFALPSLYEGFGLPVLEAMAYKTPVVVSDSSSLPEIAGRAGIYVEPENVDSIAEGLTKALKEKETAAEKSRIWLGLAQMKKFSWEKAAQETLNVLEEIGKAKV